MSTIKMWLNLHCTRYAIGRILLKRNFSTARDKFVNVLYNERTAISTLVMNRPPANAFNYDFNRQLEAALDEVERNKSKGLIVTSAIPNILAAGIDKIEFLEPNAERMRVNWHSLTDAWLKLYSSSYPTVALINGHAAAGGCAIALACEYRIIVGETYVIGLTEPRMGFPVPTWLILAMSEVIGTRQSEAALTASTLFKPAEALKIGLVDENVGSEEEGLARAHVFFERFKNISGVGRKLTKLKMRSKLIDWMKENKDTDVKEFFEFAAIPEIQEKSKQYFLNLKRN